MTPHDAQPHTDEIGSPHDGQGQAPPVIFLEPPIWVTHDEDEP